MKDLILLLMLTVGITVAMVPSSYAQTSSATVTPAGKDAAIFGDVMALNSYELMLSKLASQKATSKELRAIAERMLNDHERFDAQLTAYANRYKLGMSPDKREKYVAKVNKWDDDAAGNGLDNDIIEELVDVHRKNVTMMQHAINNLRDDELKKMVNSFLPVIKSHLDILIPLKGQIRDGRATSADIAPVDETNAADEIPAGNEKDAKFLSDLRLMNMYEVEMMELILKKGNHRALKDAAQRMLEDHQQLATQIDAYAKTKMYGNDPDEASKGNAKAVKWRQKKGGMEWDADVIEELIDAHKDGIDMLQDALTDSKDDALRLIINDALPAMKTHLDMLEPLKETVKKPWKEK